MCSAPASHRKIRTGKLWLSLPLDDTPARHDLVQSTPQSSRKPEPPHQAQHGLQPLTPPLTTKASGSQSGKWGQPSPDGRWRGFSQHAGLRAEGLSATRSCAGGDGPGASWPQTQDGRCAEGCCFLDTLQLFKQEQYLYLKSSLALAASGCEHQSLPVDLHGDGLPLAKSIN